jgi:hypothetical protein
MPEQNEHDPQSLLRHVLADRFDHIKHEIAELLLHMAQMNDGSLMELAWHAERLTDECRNRRIYRWKGRMVALPEYAIGRKLNRRV